MRAKTCIDSEPDASRLVHPLNEVRLNLDIKGQASDFSELFASVQLLPTKFATKA